MPFAGTKDDLALEWRVGLSEEIVEHVHRVVQEVLIGFPGGNMQLASQLRPQRLPIFFND